VPKFTFAVTDDEGNVLYSERFTGKTPRDAFKKFSIYDRLAGLYAMPKGYRWASADEVEWHLNVVKIEDAVWLDRVIDGTEWTELAVPEGTVID
jgi:hypothetical protein